MSSEIVLQAGGRAWNQFWHLDLNCIGHIRTDGHFKSKFILLLVETSYLLTIKPKELYRMRYACVSIMQNLHSEYLSRVAFELLSGLVTERKHCLRIEFTPAHKLGTGYDLVQRVYWQELFSFNFEICAHLYLNPIYLIIRDPLPYAFDLTARLIYTTMKFIVWINSAILPERLMAIYGTRGAD